MCLALFAVFRAKQNGAAYEVEGTKELNVLHTVSNICWNYPLVADYQNIPAVTDTFSENLQELRDASVARATVEARRVHAEGVADTVTGFAVRVARASLEHPRALMFESRF